MMLYLTDILHGVIMFFNELLFLDPPAETSSKITVCFLIIPIPHEGALIITFLHKLNAFGYQ